MKSLCQLFFLATAVILVSCASVPKECIVPLENFYGMTWGSPADSILKIAKNMYGIELRRQFNASDKKNEVDYEYTNKLISGWNQRFIDTTQNFEGALIVNCQFIVGIHGLCNARVQVDVPANQVDSVYNFFKTKFSKLYDDIPKTMTDRNVLTSTWTLYRKGRMADIIRLTRGNGQIMLEVENGDLFAANVAQ